jgi:hypothetical protein
MSDGDGVSAQHLQRLAECEMSAFLESATEVLGPYDLRLAANAWLRTMESLSWPRDHHQKFFRSVTIQTISMLVTTSIATFRVAEPGNSHNLNRSLVHSNHT